MIQWQLNFTMEKNFSLCLQNFNTHPEIDKKILSLNVSTEIVCVYLLADESDFSVRVPDLVALVQNDVVPLPWQQMVAVDPDSSIRRDQNSSAFSGNTRIETLRVKYCVEGKIESFSKNIRI